ncbi:MAG: type II toxin-antitoxin system HicB family antitoxin [Planctomycetes bacterium]|nr:type II toxin-antitoxin system HicB family antitoxin [Planctomycetota bacterium]MBL7042617.1 type II toxin-antitoxin system HicB family antitoxin [Pirellulaceae bacterium]
MQKYLVVIERAENNFSAYSPDIPGCVATGETKEAAESRMREAIRMHLDGLKEDGLPIPAPSAIAEYVVA